MIRILTLLVLLMVSSCKKDELIPSNTVTTPKIIKITNKDIISLKNKSDFSINMENINIKICKL